MKNLAIISAAMLSMLFINNLANASEGKPTFVCQGQFISIPEIQTNINIYQNTKASFVKIIRSNIQTSEVIYADEVQVKQGDNEQVFYGPNLNLQMRANQKGQVEGNLTIIQNEKVIFFPVSCEQYYHIQPAVAAE